jgi:predicted Zn-dependent peptidase
MKHIVDEITLKNGAKGILIDVPDAIVMTAEFNFRAGEYLVDPKKWETPHLMEHVLLGANQQYRKARSFQAEFEKNGAYNNASTSVYDITYEAECADFEWQRVLELMLLAISKPLFLQEEFDAEVGNVREELNGRANNHFRALSIALRKHSGYIAISDRERIKRLVNNTKDDVAKHYKRTHTTSNMRFVIAGNTKARRDQIISILDNLTLPVGDGRVEYPTELPIRRNKALYIRNASVKNMYFIFDVLHPGKLTDHQKDAASLMNTMLTETLYSNILGTAREKGLLYSMGSGLSEFKDSVSWWFGAQVMPENAHKLFDIIEKELGKVLSGDIDEASIIAAQQYLVGKYQRSAQTVFGTAAGYSPDYFFADRMSNYQAYPERIMAITKDSIIDAVRTIFQSGIWNLGVLGNVGRPFVDELNARLESIWQQK